MTGEEWAQRILEKELKREVSKNDDGSSPGMYDLRIGSACAPEIAIECVGAVDQILTETWNVGPAEGSLLLSIKGDWKIVIIKDAKVRRVKRHIERILQELEDEEIYNVRVNYLLKRYDEELFNELRSLGISHAYCFRLHGTGEVHLGIPGMGGVVDTRGGTVSIWISEFLLSAQCKDVLDKLEKSGATERHVFVIVDFGGVSWPVSSYLSKNIEHLPETKPNLPFPITGVWIASTFGPHGIRWDGSEWRLFQT